MLSAPQVIRQLPIERLQSLAGNFSAAASLMNVPNPIQVANSIQAISSITNTVGYQTSKPWRPPEWSRNQLRRRIADDTYYNLTYMTIKYDEKLYSKENADSTDYVASYDGQETQKNYYFDAVFLAEHTTTRQITEHPVQWGAAIADHSYQLPAQVVLQIGMSDAMQSFDDLMYRKDTGMGKSVNAYQMFVDLQKTGQPIDLQTHLNEYKNMIIQYIQAEDSNKTYTALRATITFKQIFIGEVGKVQKSLYPEATYVGNDSNNPMKKTTLVNDTSFLYSIGYGRGLLNPPQYY
jgi:hypothetical protein